MCYVFNLKYHFNEIGFFKKLKIYISKVQTVKISGTKPPASTLITRLISQGGKDISEAPTLCPGLTCSQEAESHTAEEPGAHGSIRNPRLLLAGGGAPGLSGVSADPPASLIGPLPMTSCSVPAGCFLIHWTLARSHGGLLYALPRPAQPLRKGWV